ncbi:hypothetical protein [Haloquadratum walsbyi]|jgi:hypothetical protein|nr:hypothetical protein [Haloquadratum walsbyi]
MTPTLNRYNDNSGYYIQARLSNLGHVTYQVTSQTEEFIADLGYSDSEDLPWGLINPLKTAGEVYTHGTGVKPQDQSAPELSPDSLPELSETEADSLMQYLEDATDVEPDIVNQVEQKINAEPDEQNGMDGDHNDGDSKSNYKSASDGTISKKSKESYFSLDDYEEDPKWS